ncbi:hypothetical protein BV25DRAFT_1679962 [Artomyces pyxidatus]|uniref:Uncharacterized protein n=1 Tax=Artomyces pyxidatus TaxID=48021 RepID=A0ACB8T919_9AGAM|nr:hypothetical protein BV25DRAFT_1679962 [Artomyces pyxidatus]
MLSAGLAYSGAPASSPRRLPPTSPIMFVPSFSDATGYMSMICWLGAQFPQVLENIRRQSVEGLALPFLANWLMGDVTNLIGCLLTHQLPFQTWLATYFCFVDISLLAQYFYYRKTATPTVAPFPHARARTTSSLTGRASLERGASHYRTLSVVAANVAAAAALAAQREEAGSTYAQTRWPRHSVDGLLDGGVARTEDEGDDDAFTAMADSFHSEGGRSSRRKHVSWSKERYPSAAGRITPGALSPVPPSLQITPQLDDSDSQARGRSLQRNEISNEGDEGDEATWQRNGEESQRRRSSRASKRGASMVFMGAWALFGIGALVNGRRSVAAESGIRLGSVLSDVEAPVANAVLPPPPAPIAVLPSAVVLAFDEPIYKEPPPGHEPPPTEEGPSMERVIGRISAWTCTTLYLTSRLPQIWKNFVRKSVEGLSMFLFIFAFLGNFFYVLSILSSPNMSGPEASAYLSETIPYLLGSGGTLVFDVTIVTQSFIYRQPTPRTRRGSVRASTHAEEEEGLMNADLNDVEEPNTPHRRRLTTPAEDGT